MSVCKLTIPSITYLRIWVGYRIYVIVVAETIASPISLAEKWIVSCSKIRRICKVCDCCGIGAVLDCGEMGCCSFLDAVFELACLDLLGCVGLIGLVVIAGK